MPLATTAPARRAPLSFAVDVEGARPCLGLEYSIRLSSGNIARIRLERRGRTRSFIHWVYVPPAYRGYGLGDVLLRRVLRDADREGVTLSLVARACGALDQAGLERWYERHGFQRGRLVKIGRSMTRPPRPAKAISHAVARRVA